MEDPGTKVELCPVEDPLTREDPVTKQDPITGGDIVTRKDPVKNPVCTIVGDSTTTTVEVSPALVNPTNTLEAVNTKTA